MWWLQPKIQIRCTGLRPTTATSFRRPGCMRAVSTYWFLFATGLLGGEQALTTWLMTMKGSLGDERVV